MVEFEKPTVRYEDGLDTLSLVMMVHPCLTPFSPLERVSLGVTIADYSCCHVFVQESQDLVGLL